jgi:hypothetical protein
MYCCILVIHVMGVVRTINQKQWFDRGALAVSFAPLPTWVNGIFWTISAAQRTGASCCPDRADSEQDRAPHDGSRS